MKRLQGCHILIVDSSEDTRRLFESVFEIEGAIVQSVDSTAKAIQIIAHSAPDLVICDIALPELDGFSLLRYIKAHSMQRQIPVLAVTAFDPGGVCREAIKAGFDGCLIKPVEIEELVTQTRLLYLRSLCYSGDFSLNLNRLHSTKSNVENALRPTQITLLNFCIR